MNEMTLGGIRTRVPRMAAVLDAIRLYGGLEMPVLVQGETGTGKELVARALHALSHRSGKPLVTADCAALPETLAESELFGHERGAFTGADRPYTGRIEAAAGGTLFLDEVNSLSLSIQAKLLRFLELGEIRRLGNHRTVAVDVRVISATNARLEDMIAIAQMRADFFYRLKVLEIQIPPLRERLDDIPLLVEQFFAEDPLARQLGLRRSSDHVLTELCSRPWPGNVRELRNTLRRSIVVGATGGVLHRLYDAPGDAPAASAEVHRAPHEVPRAFRGWMREQERRYLAELIERYPTVVEQIKVSALPERTLYRKLRLLGLQRRMPRSPDKFVGACIRRHG